MRCTNDILRSENIHEQNIQQKGFPRGHPP
jgi:hypothetical protein